MPPAPTSMVIPKFVYSIYSSFCSLLLVRFVLLHQSHSYFSVSFCFAIELQVRMRLIFIVKETYKKSGVVPFKARWNENAFFIIKFYIANSGFPLNIRGRRS